VLAVLVATFKLKTLRNVFPAPLSEDEGAVVRRWQNVDRRQGVVVMVYFPIIGGFPPSSARARPRLSLASFLCGLLFPPAQRGPSTLLSRAGAPFLGWARSYRMITF